MEKKRTVAKYPGNDSSPVLGIRTKVHPVYDKAMHAHEQLSDMEKLFILTDLTVNGPPAFFGQLDAARALLGFTFDHTRRIMGTAASESKKN